MRARDKINTLVARTSGEVSPPPKRRFPPSLAREYLLCLVFVMAFGCSKGSGGISGQLVMTDPGTAISLSPKPTITVTGRTADEFPVTFTETTQGNTAFFTIANLQSSQTYTFEVSQPGVLDTTLSFPFTINSGQTLKLGALPKGTFNAIKTKAETGRFVPSVNSQQGTVMGLVDPLGQGNCRGIQSVDLVTPGGGIVSKDGPFYFTDGGAIRAGGISDLQCAYIFFNVFPGTYHVRFLGPQGTVGENEALAVSGQISLGFSLP